ncbi:hypothetical protein Kpol_526p35 [Vanderwaltozyma polyspora DSM 70294]|uniref:RING-type E3 ubiquitin transferase n=1 Tax=Vanderwaltozyma polyspora (strain ATCC 22028 / DSM 70294 / BCRC 21397 / CBS 2163 / NBRC 10782 / NRRL Y-8283 / UCD 57-17) TaxID=436907 RepID=A7TLU0_VANPO|nr:uncharacterized protein Kpol_526p35 [Vanderwaltozyma polyspora DSM 70294]EDO16782.1 hypothetical protein Kpol_526p35 [Vanderwaltozyma polyspora DSM 70294]
MSSKSQSGGKQGSFRRLQGPQANLNKTNDDDKKLTGKKAKRHWHKNEDGTLGGANNKDHGEDDDTEICLICAEPLRIASLSPCSHKTCHKCSFRQRALYEKKSCLICRTDNELVKFTEDVDAQFDDVKNISETSEKYGIAFATNQIAEETLSLLKFQCPICLKKQDSPDLKDHGSLKKLGDHLKSTHNKLLCMICAKNKHLFISELKLYTPNQLKNHQSNGDSKGFKGHPLCAFCNDKRFYSDDELYLHMRNNHERCHICDKLNPGSPQYFKDYNQLFEHFRNSHYACNIQSCLDNKFVVFGDEFELQAHILQEHGDIIKGKPKLFQSELSTFIPTPARVIRNQNVLDDPSSSNRGIADDESLEVKRLRLEERAKHYLNNSFEDFERFKGLNDKYEKSKISAHELLASYQSLFTSQEANEYLLIHNLADTFSRKSNKYKELNAIYEAEEQRIARSSLPSLSGGSFVPTKSGIWGNSSSTSVKSMNTRNLNTSSLPTLQLQPASFDVFGSQKKAVQSYKSLTKPKKKTVVKSVVRTTDQSLDNDFTPTYLKNKSQSPAPSASSSSTSISSQNNVIVNKNMKGKDKLSSLKLESLPTPKPRVYIPPVHEPIIPDPKKWGKGTKEPGTPDDELAGLVIDGGNSKKKGKQKQLLFHIGI